ncbi:MAG: DUF5702 domain-containing protein, partial [Eubacteriales bacterium]|nr:DUF5702 domain-containing protein [Eubacteriales bacterium]
GPLAPVLDALQNKILERMMAGIADVIEPEIKASLSDLFGQLDEISDLRQNLTDGSFAEMTGQIVSPGAPELSGLNNLIQSLSWQQVDWSMVESPLVQKYFLAEYSLAYFNRAVHIRLQDGESVVIRNLPGNAFSEMPPQRTTELEQMLTGLPADEAQAWIRAQLTFLRSSITLAEMLQDEAQMAQFRSLALAAVTAISVLSSATINIDPKMLTWLFAIGQAIQEGLTQTTDLLSGEEVPLFSENLLSSSSEVASNLLSSGLSKLDWYYSDYLRLFLLAMPKETLLDRIGQQITRALGEDFATEISLEVNVQDQVLPGPSNGQHLFSLKMGYADGT